MLILVSTDTLYRAALLPSGKLCSGKICHTYEGAYIFQGGSAVPDLKGLRGFLAEQERAAKHRD